MPFLTNHFLPHHFYPSLSKSAPFLPFISTLLIPHKLLLILAIPPFCCHCHCFAVIPCVKIIQCLVFLEAWDEALLKQYVLFYSSGIIFPNNTPGKDSGKQESDLVIRIGQARTTNKRKGTRFLEPDYKIRKGSKHCWHLQIGWVTAFKLWLEIGLISNQAWCLSERWLATPAIKMEYVGIWNQARHYSDLSQWNNVIIRDGSRFWEAWSLYNL